MTSGVQPSRTASRVAPLVLHDDDVVCRLRLEARCIGAVPLDDEGARMVLRVALVGPRERLRHQAALPRRPVGAHRWRRGRPAAAEERGHERRSAHERHRPTIGLHDVEHIQGRFPPTRARPRLARTSPAEARLLSSMRDSHRGLRAAEPPVKRAPPGIEAVRRNAVHLARGGKGSCRGRSGGWRSGSPREGQGLRRPHATSAAGTVAGRGLRRLPRGRGLRRRVGLGYCSADGAEGLSQQDVRSASPRARSRARKPRDGQCGSSERRRARPRRQASAHGACHQEPGEDEERLAPATLRRAGPPRERSIVPRGHLA